MAGNLNNALEPIRDKRKKFEANMGIVKEIVEKGNIRARNIAKKTMEEVKEAIKI